MSDITAIGLGLMGSALARTLHQRGFRVTVWNRSAEKMRPFATLGVATSTDAASALAASPVTVVCIDDYTATQAVLGADGVRDVLPGRTVIQLSTGTPRQARDTQLWMQSMGTSYLDGAILCGPDDIGTADGTILLSGEREAYERARAMLSELGGDVRYLGADVQHASALDLAWLTTRFGDFMAIIHAASICRSEGARLDDFVSLFPGNPDLRRYAAVIRDESYAKRTATLAVWGAAFARIQQQGQEAGIDTSFPDFVSGVFERAVDAGHGGENVMALFKILDGAHRA